jgi:hypothetical protein
VEIMGFLAIEKAAVDALAPPEASRLHFDHLGEAVYLNSTPPVWLDPDGLEHYVYCDSRIKQSDVKVLTKALKDPKLLESVDEVYAVPEALVAERVLEVAVEVAEFDAKKPKDVVVLFAGVPEGWTVLDAEGGK